MGRTGDGCPVPSLNHMQTLELSNITLYYRGGSSDKVYQCRIEPAGERFVVNFAYGRRGSTLNTGTKTNVPVDYDAAKRTYDKLVKEKTAKGYTPGEDGTPYHHSEDKFTGILPQLLNPIEEKDALRLLNDPAYVLQPKYDGRRMLIWKQDDVIHGINKKGLQTGLPDTVLRDVQAMPGNFILDGECIGDVFHTFDLLVLNGEDLRSKDYRARLTALLDLYARSQHRFIKYATTAFSIREKTDLYQQLLREQQEGVVFKRLTAPYIPDRPSTGGPQLKYKFYATVSCVVSKINSQRSVEVRLLGKDGWVPCGNVTIPANHPIPAVLQVIEVRYLYAHRESHALYQPTYLGLRSDVSPEECGLHQLKYKPED